MLSWQSDAITLLPDVSTNENYSDGVVQTYNILKNCNELNISSPVCEYAINQIYNHNGIKYLPFVGTYIQMRELINTFYQNIYNDLLLLGFNATYKSQGIWSSIQKTYSNAYFWYGVMNNWRTVGKTYVSTVITLFSAT